MSGLEQLAVACAVEEKPGSRPVAPHQVLLVAELFRDVDGVQESDRLVSEEASTQTVVPSGPLCFHLFFPSPSSSSSLFKLTDSSA